MAAVASLRATYRYFVDSDMLDHVTVAFCVGQVWAVKHNCAVVCRHRTIFTWMLAVMSTGILVIFSYLVERSLNSVFFL